MSIEQKSLHIFLWLVGIGFFMQTLDATIVNTTLPAMALGFGESPLRMQSVVVVAYSLTMAMLIPASGRLGNLFSRLGSSCMPFLVPLLLQVNLGYSPFQSGLMMLSVAVASILTKRVTTPQTPPLGYRQVLVVNTALVGLTMASFALVAPDRPLALHIAQRAAFGAVNSMQFTAINTVTLRDLDSHMASSGNSLLSMVQMLAMSMSMGVAAAGAVLAAFTSFLAASARCRRCMPFRPPLPAWG